MWLKRKTNVCKYTSIELLVQLLNFYTNLRQNLPEDVKHQTINKSGSQKSNTGRQEQSSIVMVNSIIEGIKLRIKLINGEIVYDRTVFSVSGRLPQMTQQEKYLCDRCFYYMDKYLYRMNAE